MQKITYLKKHSPFLSELYDKPVPIRNAMLAVIIAFGPAVEVGDSVMAENEAANLWDMQHFGDASIALQYISRTLLINNAFILNAARAAFVRRAGMYVACYVGGIQDLLQSQLGESKNLGYSDEAMTAYYSSVYDIFRDKLLMTRLRFNRFDVKAYELDKYIEAQATNPKVKYYSVETWRRMIFEYIDVCGWVFDTSTGPVEPWHKEVILKQFLDVLYTPNILHLNELRLQDLSNPLVEAVSDYHYGDETAWASAQRAYATQNPTY